MQLICWGDNVKLFFTTSRRSDRNLNNSFSVFFDWWSIQGRFFSSKKQFFLNMENATDFSLEHWLDLFCNRCVVLTGWKWILFFSSTKERELVEDLSFSFLNFSFNTFGFVYTVGEEGDLLDSHRLDKVAKSLFDMFESCNNLALSIFNSSSKRCCFKPAFTWYVLLMQSIISWFNIELCAFLYLNTFSTAAFVLVFIFALFVTNGLYLFSVFAWIFCFEGFSSKIFDW